MRYKQLIDRELTKVEQLLNTLQNGLESRSITPEQMVGFLKQAKVFLNAGREKISLEHDD